MNKRTVISIIVVAMLLVVSLYFISGTYARYAGKFTGTGTVDIAKWQVKLNGGEADSFDLTLSTDDEKTDVVKGKIAPGHGASGTAEISLEGTEVAVDLKAEIDTEAIADALETAGFTSNSDNIKTEITVTKAQDAGEFQITGGAEGAAYTIALPTGGGAFGANDKVTAKITVTWDNDDDSEISADTTVGKQAQQGVEIPVKLYVYQHIDGEEFDTTKLDNP